jgi:hypothetical protein
MHATCMYPSYLNAFSAFIYIYIYIYSFSKIGFRVMGPFDLMVSRFRNTVNENATTKNAIKSV